MKEESGRRKRKKKAPRGKKSSRRFTNGGKALRVAGKKEKSETEENTHFPYQGGDAVRVRTDCDRFRAIDRLRCRCSYEDKKER